MTKATTFNQRGRIHLVYSEDPHPQDLATLQALYSRDPGAYDGAAKKMKASASGTFIDKYYIGYGHDSIGELCNFTLFIEGVSLFLAKLIQHHQLYQGQEASTRYVDWAKQPCVPGTPDFCEVEFRQLYAEAIKTLPAHLANRWELDDAELDSANTAVHNALRAASFDVARGLIPVGAETSLSWQTNSRQFVDQLSRMRLHANTLPSDLRFEAYDFVDAAYELVAQSFSLRPLAQFLPIEQEIYIPYRDNLIGRSAVSVTVSNSAIGIRGQLDFGSWRDLARHRSLRQAFVDLEPAGDSESWYTDMLPKAIRKDAADFQNRMNRRQEVSSLYQRTLAKICRMELWGHEAAWDYVLDLRSKPTVHYTLRRAVYDIMQRIDQPAGVLPSEPRFELSIRRGTQDIKEKQ